MLERWNCFYSNNITIIKNIYQYSTAVCVAKTIIILSKYNSTKSGLNEIFKIIKNEVK